MTRTDFLYLFLAMAPFQSCFNPMAHGILLVDPQLSSPLSLPLVPCGLLVKNTEVEGKS